jgi:isopenicillin N synthase-like dioxygenase
MTSPIPVIDLAAANEPNAPAPVLDLIRDATQTVGVIQVVNRGRAAAGHVAGAVEGQGLRGLARGVVPA